MVPKRLGAHARCRSVPCRVSGIASERTISPLQDTTLVPQGTDKSHRTTLREFRRGRELARAQPTRTYNRAHDLGGRGLGRRRAAPPLDHTRFAASVLGDRGRSLDSVCRVLQVVAAENEDGVIRQGEDHLYKPGGKRVERLHLYARVSPFAPDGNRRCGRLRGWRW